MKGLIYRRSPGASINRRFYCLGGGARLEAAVGIRHLNVLLHPDCIQIWLLIQLKYIQTGLNTDANVALVVCWEEQGVTQVSELY